MLCVNPVNSSDLLAGAFGTVLWRSLDGGASRNPSTTGLPVANNQLRGLWRDPSSPAVLYLQLVSGELSKSVDSGSTWSLLPAAPSRGDALAIDPNDPQVLYLGSDEQTLNKLLKSIDGGASWTGASSGIVGGVADLWFKPGDGTTIYARASGIFKSVNGGAIWTRVAPAPVQPNSGGSVFLGEALALPNRPETIITATNNEGALVFTEAFYADGFESGDTAAWSTAVP